MTSDTVYYGSSVLCRGCGKHLGIFSIVITPGLFVEPHPPSAPFPEGDCPVCYLRNELGDMRSYRDELQRRLNHGRTRWLP